MGRKISIIVISILLVSTSLLSVWYAKNVKENLSVLLEKTKISAESENIEQTKKLVEETQIYWEQQEQTLLIFISHDEVDQLSDIISRLTSLIEHDDLSEFCSQIDEALNAIEHIWSIQVPVLQHVL